MDSGCEGKSQVHKPVVNSNEHYKGHEGAAIYQ